MYSYAHLITTGNPSWTITFHVQWIAVKMRFYTCGFIFTGSVIQSTRPRLLPSLLLSRKMVVNNENNKINICRHILSQVLAEAACLHFGTYSSDLGKISSLELSQSMKLFTVIVNIAKSFSSFVTIGRKKSRPNDGGLSRMTSAVLIYVC